MKKCRIIAEAGVNHNGSLDLAKKLIDVAADAGADIVKFQSFRAEKLVTNNAPKAEYQLATTGKAQSQYEMLKSLELTDEAHFILNKYCQEKKIQFLSTPFDIDGLNFLVTNRLVSEVKIPSGEMTNAPFLFQAGASQLPIILSTGMSDLKEVKMALGVLAYGFLNPKTVPKGVNFSEFSTTPEARIYIQKQVTVLQCTTEYPAPFSEVNLRVMHTLRENFSCQVGFSDHTTGIEIPLAAAALGANLIEKHFTLDRTMEGPDHKASLEPAELKAMIQGVRNVEMALGTGEKLVQSSEAKNMAIARKSLVVTKRMAAGDIFSPENISIKRPGNGKSPFLYWDYLGKKAEKDYEPDELL